MKAPSPIRQIVLMGAMTVLCTHAALAAASGAQLPPPPCDLIAGTCAWTDAASGSVNFASAAVRIRTTHVAEIMSEINAICSVVQIFTPCAQLSLTNARQISATDMNNMRTTITNILRNQSPSTVVKWSNPATAGSYVSKRDITELRKYVQIAVGSGS